jgi:hypothetical protein
VHPIVRALVHLDRRWIFLLMAIAVMIPIVLRTEFPEKATPLVQAVFDRIESLPPGSRILMAFDYDPGSDAELQPMATALTWHCAKKGHKMYFMCLWPAAPPMIARTIDSVLKTDFPGYRYGIDYINLGFKPGNEGVIKVVTSNIKELYTTDSNGQSINNFEMMRGFDSVKSADLIVNVSAGYPGSKEWIQYAATPYKIPIATGCTGVQAPLLYPYVPGQLFGLLGAIKGAAEYEAAVKVHYPEYAVTTDAEGKPQLDKRYVMGIIRMGPQLIAHCLVLLLIVLGNVVLALSRQPRKV